MGADIHWVIERKAGDGAWEAVMSKSLVYENIYGTGSYVRPDPDSPLGKMMLIGNRSYALFSVLSRVRCDKEDGPCLLDDGMPDDASPYAIDELVDDGDLHSQGHGTIDDLRRRIAEVTTSGENNPYHDSDGSPADTEVMRYVSLWVDLVLEAANAAADDNLILWGRYYDYESDTQRPDMKFGAAHEKLAWQVRARNLKPVSPETVRILVSYDN